MQTIDTGFIPAEGCGHFEFWNFVSSVVCLLSRLQIMANEWGNSTLKKEYSEDTLFNFKVCINYKESR